MVDIGTAADFFRVGWQSIPQVTPCRGDPLAGAGGSELEWVGAVL
jgi:hypothetical protein